MAKVETVYWDNKNEKTALAYSIDGVYWLSILFKVAGILSLAGIVPALIIGLLFLFDSPTKPMLGAITLLGSGLGAIIGYFFWFGLANTLCLLIDLKGTQERLDVEAQGRLEAQERLQAEERAKARK